MEKPITVIQPQKGWKFVNLAELWQYRDLLYFMVLRDVTVIYKQTVLGFTWAIMNPLFQMLVFTVVFGKLAKVPSDGIPYPLFSFAALLPWTYFSQTLVASTNSLISGSNIFTKVYFPRIFIPLTPVLSKLVDFFIAFVFFIILLLFYGITPGIRILLLPLFIVLMMITSAGIGMWFSSMALQYRDIKFAVTFLSQLLMYAAPVVFPASLLLEKFGPAIYKIYGIYPMVGIIEGFRACFIASKPVPWDLVGIGSASALLIFISGSLYFRKMERIFADVA